MFCATDMHSASTNVTKLTPADQHLHAILFASVLSNPIKQCSYYAFTMHAGSGLEFSHPSMPNTHLTIQRYATARRYLNNQAVSR
jgi:hypothetical protein